VDPATEAGLVEEVGPLMAKVAASVGAAKMAWMVRQAWMVMVAK